jgi:hypothetical protein
VSDDDTKPTEASASPAPAGKVVTWDGTRWRDALNTDMRLPGVIVAKEIRGTGQLDPSIPVVTLSSSKGIVNAMHRRWRER